MSNWLAVGVLSSIHPLIWLQVWTVTGNEASDSEVLSERLPSVLSEIWDW